jgi:uncharacterized membrane protein YphA (DoxX/SURF4 family)
MEAGVSDPPKWMFVTRIGFRFAAIFLLLVTFPFPFQFDEAPDVLPGLRHRVVPWVSSRILPFSRTQILGNYELSSYCQLLTYSLIALVGTILWSVADRKRLAYPRLHVWLRFYVRLYLAAAIFSYGSSKLFPQQFRPPSLGRLLQRFGDYNHNGLMWAFMGSSRVYTLFAGAVEALAGVALFIPRLTTAGALLCAGALTNVLVLDIAYDVGGPRIYCFVLLLMSGFLLASDLRRLTNFFILNRSVEPAPPTLLFQRRWLKRAALGLQLAFAVCFICLSLAQDARDSRVRDEALRNNPLRGIWSVDEFEVNGELRVPLTTDPVRWQRVVFDSPPSATLERGVIDLFTIQSMSGSLRSRSMQINLQDKSILLKQGNSPNPEGQFNFSQSEPGLLILEGALDGQQIRARLRLSHFDFRLSKEGFRWLDEQPLDPWNP